MKLPTPTLGLAGWTLLAGLLLGVFVGWRVTAWINQGRELRAIRTALQAAQTQYQKRLDDLLGQVRTNQEASLGYQNELATLRAQPRDPRPVRLCVRAADPAVPQATPAEPGPTRPATPSGGVSPPDGRDLAEGPNIASDLYHLADQCDELSARLRGLQQSVLAR